MRIFCFLSCFRGYKFLLWLFLFLLFLFLIDFFSFRFFSIDSYHLGFRLCLCHSIIFYYLLLFPLCLWFIITLLLTFNKPILNVLFPQFMPIIFQIFIKVISPGYSNFEKSIFVKLLTLFILFISLCSDNLA